VRLPLWPAAKALSRCYGAAVQVAGRLYLRLYGVQVGTGLTMRSLPFCRRQAQAAIRLGDGVTIKNRLSENPAGIAHRTALVAARPGARLVIGNHVGISGAVLYCETEIVIGDHVTIGAGARIYDTDFHPIDPLGRRRHDVSQIKRAPVTLCEDVFIGANAMVLKGVTVGARTVVGAGAVVTKSFPPDVVVAGNPARIVARLGGPLKRREVHEYAT